MKAPQWFIEWGDCLERMAAMPAESVDAIVTDPPYEIGFMGKGWDASGIANSVDVWEAALRVAKPGAHLIAFGGTRAYHRMVCAIEDAGWQIRDCIAWQQWQGFPKSHDVSKAIDKAAGIAPTRITDNPTGSLGGVGDGGWNPTPRRLHYDTPATFAARQWEGWGTALKPAYEPAVLARKPLDGTVAQNVSRWGTGAINIDGCRYGYGDPAWPGPGEAPPVGRSGASAGSRIGISVTRAGAWHVPDLGRWPANVYACPKASRAEREFGCEGLPSVSGFEAVDREEGAAGVSSPRAGAGRTADRVHNHHVTVKPLAVMRWLVRLVTPPSGLVLDPFCGSGTTIAAAVLEGFDAVGMELSEEYARIARARVAAWERTDDARQINLFG